MHLPCVFRPWPRMSLVCVETGLRNNSYKCSSLLSIIMHILDNSWVTILRLTVIVSPPPFLVQYTRSYQFSNNHLLSTFLLWKGCCKKIIILSKNRKTLLLYQQPLLSYFKQFIFWTNHKVITFSRGKLYYIKIWCNNLFHIDVHCFSHLRMRVQA